MEKKKLKQRGKEKMNMLINKNEKARKNIDRRKDKLNKKVGRRQVRIEEEKD